MEQHQKGGFIYLKIQKAIWGLPKAGIIANKLLKQRLAPKGFYKVAHTPGLWHHINRNIQFTLIVNNFGVKYTNKQDAEYLIQCLHEHYKITEDWKGDLYCGIKMMWHLGNTPATHWVNISML